MADRKVSSLTVMAAGDLDPVNDRLLVSDTSASASKAMAPSEMIRASLPYLSTFWDFTTGSLLPTVSFTRASAGYRLNSSGLYVSEATDVARFQHAPVALTPRGLLIEEARTELYTYNTDFADLSWGKTGCTITGNATAAPDGTTTADLVTEGVTTQQSLGQTAYGSFVSGTTYVHRIFAKAAERNFIAVYWDPNRFGGTGFNYFDVANGVVGTASAGMTTFIRAVANGFYECVVVGTCTSSGAGNRSFWLADVDGGRIFTGNGTSGLYVWGASLQAGISPTQHIATTAATATRAADLAGITNLSALTDQCWVIRARTPRTIAGATACNLLQIDEGAGFNRRAIYYQAGRLYVLAQVGGATTCLIDLGAIANDTDFTVAARWADNNFAASLNGGAIASDLSGANPIGMTTARIGRHSSGGFVWNSTIRSIETRRTASDTELPLLAA